MKKGLIAVICALSVTFACTAAYAEEANVYVNGEQLTDGAYIIEGKVYVPLRAVSETIGATCTWNESSQSAYINFNEDEAISNIIEQTSASVVAIVGNYKPEFMTQQALSYNESYAHGTGVVIKNNGLILTNAHVVNEIENITV
ncbi:MAG: stalk domain-containing protein, partial [Bacillota bacterium]|nr:stalk domain-containing protein [Bacillota bacterium]